MVVTTPIELRTTEGLTSGIRRRSPLWHSTLGCVAALAVADAVALAVALAATLDLTGSMRLSPGGLMPAAVLAAVASVLVCVFAARRHVGTLVFDRGEPMTVLAGCLLCMVGTGFVDYALHVEGGLEPLLVMWGLSVPALLAARGVARAALERAGLLRNQVVVVGAPDAADDAAGLIEGSGRCRVTGVVTPDRLGTVTQGRWAQIMRQHHANLVLLAVDDVPRAWMEWLVRDGVSFMTVTGHGGAPVLGSFPVRTMGQDAVVRCYRNNLHRPVARASKRAFDAVTTLAMLLFMVPLLAVIAAAIKLDGGPILYAHRRIGADGRSFPCLKFRSMVPDSDALLAHALRTDPALANEWRARQKLRNDPRVTLVGRFLRQTSLDELPQLFNVLRGEMSLVGPRPIVQDEVSRYGADIHHYYATRPGITGLWQVSGRSDTGYTQRIQLDVWYVKNWSLWNDLLILWRTVPAVLARRGAV